MSTELANVKTPELIRVPNGILEVLAEFSVYQLRIYVTIIELMQEATKKSFKDGEVAIRAILAQEMILLCIPLRKISKPSEYRDVKQSLLQMSKINCEMTYVENGKKQIMSGSLFTVDMPFEANWKSKIKIRLHPQVAKLMLTFQRNAKGDPVFYSKFNPIIVQTIKNKHTIRLYLLLCLWRHKTRMNISIEKLYRFLGLGSTYAVFSNFKKHILLPSHKHLSQGGDVWFDIDDGQFLVKDGNKVIGLNFKLMTQGIVVERELKMKTIKNILTIHYSFKATDFEQLKDVLEKVPYTEISNKISELHSKITPNIKYPKRYIITSLKEAFQLQ